MMDRNHFLTQTCRICRVVERGRFSSPAFWCKLHQRDEIELHESMPADRNRMSKEDKALERIYAKRWKQ